MADAIAASAQLAFHEVAFEPVVHSGAEPWMRYRQIADALGYSRPSNLLDLYNANAAEFTDSMTALVKLPTPGGMQEVRIFSLRGAHLLGMFARTERAAEFRRWVLDVLDQQATDPAAPALPPPVATQQVLATLDRVIRERDTLRKLVGKQLLKDKPHYHRVIRYFNTPGLSMAERARLMGWKTSTLFFQALHELAACGLIDWAPDPKRAEIGRQQVKKIREMHLASGDLVGRKKGTGAGPEQMAKARAARAVKCAALRGEGA